jgi:DNA-binding beta-propeller fold protein YncE
VANFLSNTVDRISADGTRMQFSGGANIKGPIGLVCDDTGNVYVANYNGNTVARISPAGVSSIIGTVFKQPYYLTLDRDGNLFVSQQEDNTIVRITLPKTVVTKP